MTEFEAVRKVRNITHEMIKNSVKDVKGVKVSEQDKAVELLARVIHDFSDLYLNDLADEDEVLKGILVKVKIASNMMDQLKKPRVMIKRV